MQLLLLVVLLTPGGRLDESGGGGGGGEVEGGKDRLGVGGWTDGDLRLMSARVVPGDFLSGGGGVCMRDIDCCLPLEGGPALPDWFEGDTKFLFPAPLFLLLAPLSSVSSNIIPWSSWLL